MKNLSVNRQSSIRYAGEKVIYFDPWDVPGHSADADVIFITHDHFDHYVAAEIMKLKKADTVVVVPASFSEKAAEEIGANVLSVVPGKTYRVSGLTFETVAAYNVNKEFHPKSSGFCGYVLPLDGKRWYVMGDSDATQEAAATKCDVLMLPIGGYYTMDYQEAADLTAKIAPETVIPTHYGDVIGEKSFGDEFAKLVKEKAPEIKVELVLYQ